jgi:hypothetical protein
MHSYVTYRIKNGLRLRANFCHTRKCMVFSPRPRALLGLSVICSLLQAQTPAPPKREYFRYEAEWRLIRAGTAEISWNESRQADLKLFTSGLVAQLYRLEDSYKATYDPGLCIVSSLMDAQEGKRHRDTRVTYDRANKRSNYVERDVQQDKVVNRKELDIPACVHDVLGALHKLREQRLQPGQNWEVPSATARRSFRPASSARKRKL